MTLIKVITYFTCVCGNHKVTAAGPSIVGMTSEIGAVIDSNTVMK
jgi:hypothetical protein